MKNIFSLFSAFLVSSFLMSSFLCSAVFASQEVEVLFDLEAHTVSGISRLHLDAGQELSIHSNGLDVKAVLVNGKEAVFESSGGLLHFTAATQSREVDIAFHKEISPEEQARTLIGKDGIVLLDLWYPVPDKDMPVRLSALIPDDFYAVSEADDIVYKPQSQGKKVSFTFPHSVPYVHFVAGPYQVKEEILPGGTLLATYFFPEDQSYADSYAAKTKEYLARYEKLIGPYPYKRFSVVENRLPTGFAMPTFTLLGQSVVRLPFITETSLGHEVLHSWFGNAVDVDYGQGNWCEGLTTYLADQAYAADKGEDVAFRKGQLVKYRSHVASDNTMTVADFKGAGDHSIASQASRAVGYNKVSMIFHMLRMELGEENFIAGLRDFYEQNKFQSASWDDIKASFERVSEKKLGPFFEQWLSRADVPSLGVKGLRLDFKDGEPELSFKIVQQNDSPYELSVAIVVDSGQGQIKQDVQVAGAATPVTIPLTSFPTRLSLDPDYDLMRALSPDEVPAVWSRFRGSAAKIAVVDEARKDAFAPFFPVLEELDCSVVTDEELDDALLAEKDVLLLGTGSKASRGMFARPQLPDAGFTVEVRENPLAPGKVAVLVEAQNAGEVEAAVHKLRHYGKYGYLHFAKGKIEEKNIPESDTGQIYLLDQQPRGAAVEKSLEFNDIIEKIARSRIVYVGETHVNQADHILQYRVLKAIHDRYPELAIGMEMFNKNSQEALDAYIAGEIGEREFLKKSEYYKNWGYDYRFYRDILQFARRYSLPVIALNLDKEIVSNTFKNGGIAGLEDEVKETLPQERNLDMPGYRERLSMVFQGHSGPHFNEQKLVTFVQAQVLWDETMAQQIVDFLQENPERKMIVIAGSGHVVKENAIPPRVARRLDAEQSVVVNVRENELAPEEADYVFFSAPVNLPPSPKLGVMLEEKDDGPTITALSPQGSAKNAGLDEDDIILAIGGKEVKSVEDIKIELLYKEHGNTVQVKVLRPVFLLPDAVLNFDVTL